MPGREQRALKLRLDNLGALGERNFRLLFFAQAATALGDRMAPLALAFAVFGLGGSPSDLGLVLAAGMLPLVVFVIPGGVWADRVGRREVMIAADVTRALSQGAAATLLVTGHAEIWHLASLAAVGGTASAFFYPAAQGLIRQAVSGPRLQQANSLVTVARNSTGIGGPALSALLVATIGPGWAIGIDSLTFAASAIFIGRARVPRRERTGQTVLGDLRAGWHEFSRRTWVWASVLQFGLFQFASLAVFLVLGPYVADDELGGPAAWAAIMVGASLGSLVGAASTMARRPRRPMVFVFLAMMLFAPQFVLLAIPAPTLAIAAAAFVGHGAINAAGTVWFTTLQENVPADAVSRVSSYDWLGSLLLMPLGLALVGPVAETVGVSTTLVVSGAWTVVSALVLLSLPSIRAVQRLPAEAEAEEAETETAPAQV